ncbi:MAG: helix-turn-helix domain-containing protein [Caldilineaceae bacterium]
MKTLENVVEDRFTEHFDECCGDSQLISDLAGQMGVDPLLCPVEVASRIIGQKWTLQIVKTLLDYKSLRFCELQAALGGVNPSTLSSRLKMLEDEGMIRRVQISAIPPHVEYSLTKMGGDLESVIHEISRWSSNWLCTPERIHEWELTN